MTAQAFILPPDPADRGRIADNLRAFVMQAMDEFYAAPLDSTLTTPEDAINWLEWRASELMREWGFDIGEDA